MPNELANRTHASGILADAVSSILLIIAFSAVDRVKIIFFEDKPPAILSVIFVLSDLTLLLAFIYVFVRTLKGAFTATRPVLTEMASLLTRGVVTPTKLVFGALRAVGNSTLIGIMVGGISALIVILAIAMSVVSIWFTIALIVPVLILMGLGLAAVIAEARGPAPVVQSASGAAILFFFMMVCSLPFLGLMFAGLAERWTGLAARLVEAMR